jgi:hypothetical protein
MKIPNAEKAIISDEKLEGYCLNAGHSNGQHKAYLFSRLLGITSENMGDLRALLEASIMENDVIRDKPTEHRTIYYVDSEVIRNERHLVLRSLWIILTNEIIPPFVSCYIRRKGAK